MALIDVDTRRYEASGDGSFNSLAKLTDDYYIIPYRGAANDSFVQAIRAYSDWIGRLGDYEFSALTYRGGHLITVAAPVRAVCWKGGDQIRLFTLSITDAGVITSAIISSVVIDGGICGNWPEIIHRAGTVYLMYFDGANQDGWVRTRHIAADGTIGAAISSWEFVNATFSLGLSNIIPISGDIYAAVFWDNVSNTTRVVTFTVTAAGVITAGFAGALQIEAGRRTGHHYITPIAGGTKYAIVWEDSEDYPSNRIMLATVDITNLGVISAADGPTNLETRNYNREPSILFYDTGEYLVVYSGYDLIGKRVSIAVDGTIGSVLETTELSIYSGDYPSVVNRTGKQFIIAHGTASYGWATWVGLAPVITNQAVDNIAPTTADGHGNATALGEPDADQHGHCWDTLPNPTVSDDKTELGAVVATGPFTSNLTGLTPGTTYYVRAYARTGDAVTYGAEVTFGTIGPATVTSDPATDILQKQAAVNGTLDDDGNEACDCGFEWGETDGYGNTTPTQSKTTGESFSQLLSELSPNVTYHFRAFATNSFGTSYGADRTFSSLELPRVNRSFALSRQEL